MKKNILIGVLVIVLAGCQKSVDTPVTSPSPVSAISSFDECVAAGNPVMESYPPRCNANGQTFTQEIGNESEFSDEISVGKPLPNQVISNPLQIDGKARGNWFFEANFSAELIDANGKSLGEIPVQADAEWMTEEFVPFSGEIIFTTPETLTGSLIFKNANPSGLPENDKQIKIPVTFQE